MEQQVVQEFNAESGKWDVMPPEAPVEAKPAVEPPADVDDPPSKATPAVEAKAVPDAKVAKPRNDPQARIDQVIAKQKDAERRLADAERRAEDAERRAAATKEPVTEPAKAAATSDDFPSLTRWLEQHPESANSDDPLRDYNRAFYTHMRNEERKQEADAKQSAHVEQTFATKVHTFSTKYADAITADPDRESRIDKGLLQVRPYSLMTAADKAIIRNLPNPAERDRVAFQCFLADQWIDSEHPVELLEHLSDPKEFQRLASLPPNAVVREIARFEAGLGAATSAEPAPKATPPTSKAAPPITPLGSSPHVPDDSPSEEDSDEVWRLKEEARMARQRRGRG